MVHWIAFDDDTAEAVVSRLRRGAAEIQHNTPVDAALHTDSPSVIVLPSSTPGKLLLARFIPRKDGQLPTAPRARTPMSAATANARTSKPASAPPFQKKPAASAKKPWWRKIVA
jgi:hypothetical protein